MIRNDWNGAGSTIWNIGGSNVYSFVIYLLAAVGIIGLVLIQQGKGADMGASFGAGASNTVFGASGSGNFLTRMTAFLQQYFYL